MAKCKALTAWIGGERVNYTCLEHWLSVRSVYTCIGRVMPRTLMPKLFGLSAAGSRRDRDRHHYKSMNKRTTLTALWISMTSRQGLDLCTVTHYSVVICWSGVITAGRLLPTVFLTPTVTITTVNIDSIDTLRCSRRHVIIIIIIYGFLVRSLQSEHKCITWVR